MQTAAVQPVTQTASPAPVPPPDSALAHEPAALAEPPAAARPKPRPAVAKRETPRRPSRLDDEALAAPQPTHAEVAQNTPPPAPVAAQTPEQAAHPAPALTPPPGTQTAPPPPREPKTVAIPAGTTLTVRVNETLSTETNYSGDTFTASLDKPLVVDGFVIADRGARVIGKITQAQKAGRVKGVSELALALTQIHTTDGQTVAIETTPWTKQVRKARKEMPLRLVAVVHWAPSSVPSPAVEEALQLARAQAAPRGTGAVLTMRGKAAHPNPRRASPSRSGIAYRLPNA